jgi:DNA-directed RNA polymerase beta' subunit
MAKNIPAGLTYYSEVQDVCFYVLGTQEILTESSINITSKEVLKGTEPMPEGIYDAHMGTTDHQWDCATCGNEKTVCPGHPGSIDLRYPVKSPMFRDYLLKWLKVICFYCGSTVIPIKHVKPTNRLAELVRNVRQVKQCTNCKMPHMQVVRDKKRPAIFYRVQEEGKIITKKEEFYNHEIEQVMQRVTCSTVLEMGYPLRSHPNKFILRSIKAPPNTMRPDVRRIGGARSSNPDTTSLMKQIIEINDALPEELPANDKIGDFKEMYFNLDMTYFAMVKGGGGGDIKMVTNTNKPPVAIAEHWPKKSGRIRRNLMGKRVEYMIRSVITGDSRLKINEVGIPLTHARNLEIPETVSDKNIARLLVYYTNKADRYPGCKRIIKKSNGRIYRTEKLADYQLQIGDVVFRDMIDGDYINFNRQPTLIFSSIAGLRVVIMHTGNTLRINPSVCKMFNADFDGDQMNCIVPSGIQARNECMTLSNVSRWVISPQNQAPMIGAFQDGAIGLSELTKDGLRFNKWHAMNMLADIETASIDYRFDQTSYTNRELVSRLLPKINVINKEPTMYKQAYEKLLKYNPNDIKVNIIRGKLISGVLDKATAGEGVPGSIFHVIANEYGNAAALETVYNLQQIVHSFFLYHGFTVGIADINISDGAMKEVKRRIASMILESRKITQRLNNNKLIPPIGMSLYDFNELEQMNVLTNGDDFVDPIFADIDLRSNMMARLILSGSKGKVPNFIDLNGALGVLTINGKRFGPQAGWGRTSCYFTRYDTDPAASGFISMSYREGISNDVYSFVAGQARHGAISNALSTSITGYQNRISIKNLESILVNNLRAATKGLNVIQPLYAECGLDPAKMEKVKFPTVLISDEAFANYKTDIKSVDKKFQNPAVEKLLELEFEQLTADRLEYRRIFTTLEDHNPKEFVLSDSKQMPVNLNRIIDDTIYNYSELIAELKENDKILNIIYVIESVKNLCSSIGYVYLNEIQQRTKKPIPHYIITSTKLMQIMMRSYLSTSYLLKKQVTNQLKLYFRNNASLYI